MDNVNQDTERSSELEQKQEEMRKRHTRELSARSEEEQSLTQTTSNIPGVAPLGEDGSPIRKSTWVQTQKQFRFTSRKEQRWLPIRQHGGMEEK